MAIPKHVENFIQDEEEFGEAATQTLASMGKSEAASETAVGRRAFTRNASASRTLQAKSRRARQ